MAHEFDGIIVIEGERVEDAIMVRIKFCTCDGKLVDDRRIHSPSEMYQFIVIHMQQVASSHDGVIEWKALHSAVLAYFPMQNDHIFIGPVSIYAPDTHYQMVVTPAASRSDVWPSIDMRDMDIPLPSYDDELIGMFKAVGLPVYVMGENGPQPV